MSSYGVRINLPLPVVGAPNWDDPLNELLQELIDVLAQRVTVDGLDITTALDLQGNALINASNIGFITDGDPGTPNTMYYSSDGELFVRDGFNRVIQITSGGVINVGGTGGFGGDYVSTNQNGASYINSTQTFSFTSAGGTVYSTMEHGAVKIHAATSDAVTLQAPTGLTPYTITFPNNVPAGARAIVTADATGSLAFSLSASFTESIPMQSGIADPLTAPDAQYVGGIWTLGPAAGGTVDLGIPYTFGDRIDAIQFGTTGVQSTASLYHVNTTGTRTLIVRKAFNGGPAGLQVLQSGSHTMTGTLPYTPPGTGSLYLAVANGPAGYENVNVLFVIKNRKLIS